MQPVVKALQVLQLVCEAPQPVSLNELVKAADLPKTTVFRYLRSLASKRLIEHEEATDRYRPGIGLWQLSHSSNPYEMLRQICQPHLQELRDRFNETVNLGVLAASEVLYLDIMESRRSLRMQAKIGSTGHLHSTALGKVLLAFQPRDQAERILPSVLVPMTARTIVDRQRILEQLDVIRATGYAVDEGEDEEGSCCIAAPILNDKGNAIAAMSLSAPDNRMTGVIRQTICAQLIPACHAVAQIIRGTMS
ncbi:IclR family transcriptional regulator [Nordella sp. HKS 07]|uniref:IclR family transcriptional regulator n=1 Tax=Nordella sp. HKS 07 TaxID=2712222 RepID=UPI0013E12C2C|nr:IclR family transcriptional regulator [Nordella sp. HKS 07]QIG49333.1 IclR family transcriptional regulator [Nordella sp. HKS 07]